MEDSCSRGSCAPLPFAALRLLIPPIRLLSAVAWQTIQRRLVADYGTLEEFVSMITDIVPELVSSRHRAQLILGLRGRLILELCQCEETANAAVVQPHLDRMHTLMEDWTGAANQDIKPYPEFVNMIKQLLDNPLERQLFYESTFPEAFGPETHEALQSLMWQFLSSLEKLLPTQTIHQVASMIGEALVLKDCLNSVSGCEQLKTVLRHQRDCNQQDHNGSSVEDTCTISPFDISSIERMETENRHPPAQCLQMVSSCTQGTDKKSTALSCLTLVKSDAVPENQNQIKTDIAAREAETVESLEEFISAEQTAETQHDQVGVIKDCIVQLERLEVPVLSESRSARPNRGLRMKRILLEVKRGHRREGDAFSGLNSSDDEDPGSRDSSWSYYSDEETCWNTSTCSSDSWSYYSDDSSSFVFPVSSPQPSSLSSSFTDEPFSTSLHDVDGFLTIGSRQKNGTLHNKASSAKKPRKSQCFLCGEQVTNQTAHMKIHFPNGSYACPRCDSRFKRVDSLKLHLKRICFDYRQQQQSPQQEPQQQQQMCQNKTQELYQCSKCSEVFKYKLSLKAHERTHNELYCTVCRKVLRDEATLARHKESHTPFQCTRCSETFAIFRPLLKHCENFHNISRPFKCNHCPKTFSRLRILIRHEWKHTGHLPFRCALCSLRFRNDTDLICHQRVHTRERPYLCAECGKTFTQKSNLLRHLHFIHSESRNEKKYFCSNCEKSFKEKGALIKHQKNKHNNGMSRHPCPYCGKMLSASSLVRHKLIHTGERPYKCTVPECEKYFRSTSEVKKHFLTHHSTERPYKCDICGKGFINMWILNTHYKIHSGVKPFVCPACNKTFSKLSSLKRHKKFLHTVMS